VRYPLNASGFAPGRLEVETAGLLTAARLFQDGALAPKGAGRNQFSLRRDDGTEAVAQLHGQLLDPIPQVRVDDERIRLAPPFAWYEWLLAGLPLLLLAGGALGGVLGGLFVVLNGRILRAARIPLAGRAAACVASFGVAVVIYRILALLLGPGRH